MLLFYRKSTDLELELVCNCLKLLLTPRSQLGQLDMDTGPESRAAAKGSWGAVTTAQIGGATNAHRTNGRLSNGLWSNGR